MIEKLKTFIKDNNLSFEEGERNTNATILCGYALFIGVDDIEVIESAIHKKWYTEEMERELQRVFKYAKHNNYGKWWEKPEAKKMYSF